MSNRASIRRLAVALAVSAASFALILGEPAQAQTTQQPAATTPGTAPTTIMPMQQMEHGGQGMGMSGQEHQGMMGGQGMSGQGHQGMMGGQGQSGMPMGSTPQCPPGQTASGNPPTCR